MNYLLGPNMEMNLNGYFVENCCFPADGVSPDYFQQVAVSDLGNYSLPPNMEIKLDSCFAETCWFPARGVDPN